MREFEAYERPPPLIDHVALVEESEGVFVVAFASPVFVSCETDDGWRLDQRPVVSTLALTASAATALASQLCMLIARRDNGDQLPN